MHHRLFVAIFMLTVLAGCGGNSRTLTTYPFAAKSLTTGNCSQQCWSQSKAELKEASCANEQASIPLQECVKQLREQGHLFVTEGKAQTQLKACMQSKGWWLVYAHIYICE